MLPIGWCFEHLVLTSSDGLEGSGNFRVCYPSTFPFLPLFYWSAMISIACIIYFRSYDPSCSAKPFLFCWTMLSKTMSPNNCFLSQAAPVKCFVTVRQKTIIEHHYSHYTGKRILFKKIEEPPRSGMKDGQRVKIHSHVSLNPQLSSAPSAILSPIG